jgi:hypothetical protein
MQVGTILQTAAESCIWFKAAALVHALQFHCAAHRQCAAFYGLQHFCLIVADASAEVTSWSQQAAGTWAA